MPENTVKVDRTTKWGNPFIPGQPAPFGATKGQLVADKRHAFVLYRSLAPLNENLVAAARAELAGKNLACWCSREDACHAAILLDLANASFSGRDARTLAEKIADALFHDGAGEVARRLILELEDGRIGGGWCRSAVIDRIESILRDA